MTFRFSKILTLTVGCVILSGCNINDEIYSSGLTSEFSSNFVGEYSLSRTCENELLGNTTISIKEEHVRLGDMLCDIRFINELAGDYDLNLTFSECHIDDVEMPNEDIAFQKVKNGNEVIVKHGARKPYPIFRCDASNEQEK